MSVVLGFVPTDEGRAALAYAIKEAVLREVSLKVISVPSADDVDLDRARKTAPRPGG